MASRVKFGEIFKRWPSDAEIIQAKNEKKKKKRWQRTTYDAYAIYII